MRWFTLLSLALIVPALGAADKPFVGPQPSEEVTRLALPFEAQAAALDDLKRFPTVHRVFMRYLWIREPAAMTVKNLSFAINTISCSELIIRPAPVAGGMLIRIDLRDYTDSVALKRWLIFWEELAFDPSFSLLVTKDILDNLKKQNSAFKVRQRRTSSVPTVVKEAEPDWNDPKNWEEVTVDPYIQNGRTYTTALVKKKFPKVAQKSGIEIGDTFIELPIAEVKFDDNVNVIRLDADHLNPAVNQTLQSWTGSLAPVVEADYFLFRALSTIQDKGKDAKDNEVYKTIYGGLYYEFAGIQTAKQRFGKDTKATDLDALFKDLGLGDAEKGITAEKLFADLRSDRRSGVSRSAVAGEKPRQVEVLPNPLAPPEVKGIVSITHDIEDEHIDINSNPIKNLLKFQDDAREVIWVRRNGLHGFSLYNGQGVLQREVPFNVANDSTIPKPFTQRLQGAISCIRCHASESGWRSAPNDVAAFIKGKKADIFGDLTNGNDLIDDTNRRLAGLYQGQFDGIFESARDDYAKMILKATGPSTDKEDPAQLKLARIMGDSVGLQYNHYAYEAVDPQKALRELGFKVPKSKAKEIINELLPPMRSYHPVAAFGAFSPEDSTIALLKQGIPVNRFVWNAVYTQALTRSRAAVYNLTELEKGDKK